jgi:hypothetical protein
LRLVAFEWLNNAKRKPTPSDFLDLSNEADTLPGRILRLKQIIEIPVLDVIVNQNPVDDKLVGCPILLARLMKLSHDQQTPFSEKAQLDYLKLGLLPEWATEAELRPIKQPNVNMPTRDELLATMTPEQRIIALQK